MNVTKKELDKSRIEIIVELSFEDFEPYIKRGAEKLSQEVKIEGFRPGKVPYDILKTKIGEMSIMEEGAHFAVNKTLPGIIDELGKSVVGQPDISISKLAPNNPLEYKAVLALVPEVTLGVYKDLGVVEKKVEVGEDEIKKALKELSEMNVVETVVEREIKDTDKILLDIEMFLDKVPVEGGQGKGTMVIIGKDYVVPGFDKKLIGAKKGEIREFDLHYPADFHQKNLAGKKVEFRIKINEVFERVIPEVDDDAMAKNYHFKDAEDLKKNVKKSIEQGKNSEVKQAFDLELLNKIIDKSKFGELPELLIQSEIDTMMREYEAEIEKQGGRFEDYLTAIKKTRGQLMIDMTPDAIKRVKTTLAIREVAHQEKIEVGAEEIEHYIEHQLSHYKNDEAISEKLKSREYKHYVANILTNKKVIEKLREWNKA